MSATYISQFAHPKKQHGQQYVGNNVSSFARALGCAETICNKRYLGETKRSLKYRFNEHHRPVAKLTALSPPKYPNIFCVTIMTLMTLIVREYENQEKPISFQPHGLIKQER